MWSYQVTQFSSNNNDSDDDVVNDNDDNGIDYFVFPTCEYTIYILTKIQ